MSDVRHEIGVALLAMLAASAIVTWLHLHFEPPEPPEHSEVHRTTIDAWSAGYERGLSDGLESCGQPTGAGLDDAGLYGAQVKEVIHE